MAGEDLGQNRRLDEVERLQDLLDQAPSFMAVIGRDRRFYLANRAYRDMLDRAEVVGADFDEIFPPSAFPEALPALLGIFESGKAIEVENRRFVFPPIGGRPANDLTLDFIAQPIVEHGHVIAVFVAGTDVTARYRAERQLRESEARFRLIADSAPVPMWVSKADRTRSFVNKAYADFLGLPYAEAAALDWREILHPDDFERIVQESVAGEASLQPFFLEARFRDGDGQWHWLRSRSQPRLGPDGSCEGFIGVAHDITAAKEAEIALEQRVAERTAELQTAVEQLQREVADRERAEDALRQAQKMEAVGQLTGGIAHDFNNLLTPVIGGLEMVVGHLAEPRLRRLGEGALESARRGAKLATQLLAFSRVQRIAMTPVDVNQVIANMGQILRHAIGPRIATATVLDPDAGHALCDANQLENSILNLSINARDAMPDGGRLTVSTQVIDAPEEPDLAAGRYVRISIEDDGQGMPPEVLERALEPFFSTKPVGKGTGLGLAQVYAIARQSGGTVRIDSREGEGARIDMFLPQVSATGEAIASRPPKRVQPAARIAAIALVDDDPEVRTFLTDALAELGHIVTAFDSGPACLAALDTVEADLFLIDFAMPGMNGAELAEQLRARRPGQRIAFVTGYAETDSLLSDACADLPVLRKPFSLSELAALIESETIPT